AAVSRAGIFPAWFSMPNRLNRCRLDRGRLDSDRFRISRDLDSFLRVIASRAGVDQAGREEMHARKVDPGGAASHATIGIPTSEVGGLAQTQHRDSRSYAGPAKFAHVSSPFPGRIADAAIASSAQRPGVHPPAGAAGTIAATFPRFQSGYAAW